MTDDSKYLVKFGWNEYAKRASNERRIFEEHEYLINFINQLKPKSKILDVGCGSGIPITKYLIDKGFEVTGIDLSDAQIKKAKEKLPKGKFLEMDLENINFNDDSFDTIVCLHSIYHTPKINHFSTLKKFYETLKTNGFLIITTGCEDWEGINELYEEIKMFWSHFNKEKNIQMLIDAGFIILFRDIYKILGKNHLLIVAQKVGSTKTKLEKNIIYSS